MTINYYYYYALIDISESIRAALDKKRIAGGINILFCSITDYLNIPVKFVTSSTLKLKYLFPYFFEVLTS